MRTFEKKYGNINDLAIDLIRIERSLGVKVIETVLKDISLPNKVYFSRIRFMGRQRILPYTRIMRQINPIVKQFIPIEIQLRMVEKIEYI